MSIPQFFKRGSYFSIRNHFGAGLDVITACRINPTNGGIINNSCNLLNDPLFNTPADVILNSSGTIAYVANTGNNAIAICPVTSPGVLGTCTSTANFDLQFSGLMLNADDSVLYITHFDDGSVTKDVSVCVVNPNGSLGACTTHSNANFNGVNGRLALDVTGTPAYIANFNNDKVAICDPTITTCSPFTDTNATIHGPMSVDTNASGEWLYLPNFFTQDISICPISSGNLSACQKSTADSTLSFNNSVLNLFMRNANGSGYIPNSISNNISVCKINPTTGNLVVGSCHRYAGNGKFTSPVSVWIN